MPFGAETWKRRLSRDFTSLREMLFVWAMENVILPTFPHQAKYHHGKGNQTPEAEDLARFFERMGFVRLPYPRHCLLFERDGAAIRLYRPPEAPRFSFQLGMRNPNELKHFQALVEDNTDMVRL
ncbi:hypothetical protein DAT35_21170 [Vitiosangium sp. GDMCC 1.1324]|nr:hypothetical protein DAT35_21170 [Vitiosangium sp. GDMCC 1.1324]